jgi:hypothetical protein
MSSIFRFTLYNDTMSEEVSCILSHYIKVTNNQWLIPMDEWTIKTPNPICRLNRLCGILFNRFYRLEIHSLMVCIFDPACELLHPWTKDLYGTCVLLPLYCTFSLTSSPLPPFPMYSLNRQCVTVGGGGVLKCTVDHILQEFYTLFLTRFRTYKIASQPQAKMTSKDDIKGLVSLKFLRP